MPPAICFEGVTKRYGPDTILEDIELTIEKGESVVLLGPSGSGKSVFLRLIAGLEQPTQGQITLAPATNRNNSLVSTMVFQHAALFDNMTVRENIEFAWHRLRPDVKTSRPLKERIEALILRVQLTLKDLNKVPSELSGGMAKRAALARALIANPELLLYDEPSAGLDPATTEQISRLIRRFHRPGSRRITSLTVTHDYRTAAWIADRVLYLDVNSHSIKTLMDGTEIRELCRPHIPPNNPGHKTAIQIDALTRVNAVPSLAETLEARACDREIFRPRDDIGDKKRGKGLHIGRRLSRLPLALASIGQSIVGLRPPGDLKVLLRRFIDFGLGSIPYIAGSGLLVGLALSILLVPILSTYGQQRQLPDLLATALLQEIAPLLTALLLAGRFGASIAAEVGAMVVTEQLDALRTLKETPERYLLTPILEATLILQPLLTFLFVAAALAGAYLHAVFSNWIRQYAFVIGVQTALDRTGIAVVIVKSLVFGAIIALTGYQLGKSTGGSASDVGKSSRAAVVYASILIILADLLLSQLFVLDTL